MIMEMDCYIGVVDLSASGEDEIAYPFQRHLGIDLRNLSESQIQSYSDLKTEILSLIAQATENLHILFVLSQTGTQKFSAGLEAIGQIFEIQKYLDDWHFFRKSPWPERKRHRLIQFYVSSELVRTFFLAI